MDKFMQFPESSLTKAEWDSLEETVEEAAGGPALY